MVMEYVAGGELFDYIVSHGRIKEKDARKFIRQMISALEYCHAHLVIHRDLKPENLLLDEGLNIKITDFGLSNIMKPGQRFSTFCGSLHYACPEILKGEEYVGPGVDIWAMGVILYCLVVGSQPWDGKSSDELLDQIFTEGLVLPEWISEECADLIIKMLRVKEKDRITLAEMKLHPWVTADYNSPPPCYLPEQNPVSDIDDDVMRQLVQIGFHDTPDARAEILSNQKTQLVVTYHLLHQNLPPERRLKRRTSSISPASSRDSSPSKRGSAKREKRKSIEVKDAVEALKAVGRKKSHSVGPMFDPNNPRALPPHLLAQQQAKAAQQAGLPEDDSQPSSPSAATAGAAGDSLHGGLPSVSALIGTADASAPSSAGTDVSPYTSVAGSPRHGAVSPPRINAVGLEPLSPTTVSPPRQVESLPAHATIIVPHLDASRSRSPGRIRSPRRKKSDSVSSPTGPNTAAPKKIALPKLKLETIGRDPKDEAQRPHSADPKKYIRARPPGLPIVSEDHDNLASPASDAPRSASMSIGPVPDSPVSQTSEVEDDLDSPVGVSGASILSSSWNGDKANFGGRAAAGAIPRKPTTGRPILDMSDLKKEVDKVINDPAMAAKLKKPMKPHPLVSPRHAPRKSVKGIFELPLPEQGNFDDMESPRSLTQNTAPSALFGVSTTTSLPSKDIRKRIVLAVDALKLICKQENSNLFRCSIADITLDIEIMKIQKLKNMRGVKLSRVSGDVWAYKAIADKLVAALGL